MSLRMPDAFARGKSNDYGDAKLDNKYVAKPIINFVELCELKRYPNSIDLTFFKPVIINNPVVDPICILKSVLHGMGRLSSNSTYPACGRRLLKRWSGGPVGSFT